MASLVPRKDVTYYLVCVWRLLDILWSHV